MHLVLLGVEKEDKLGGGRYQREVKIKTLHVKRISRNL